MPGDPRGAGRLGQWRRICPGEIAEVKLGRKTLEFDGAAG